MKLNFIITPIVFICLCISCVEKNTRSDEQSTINAKKVTSSFDSVGISKAVFQNLLKQGDHIDIIFNDLPISMNQDGNTALYQDLQYISSRPLTSLNTNCTPLARKIYLSKGEIIMEGDLYYAPECYFQVFIKDGKELYGNYLTPKGVAFVAQLLQQAEAVKPTQ